MLTTPIVSNMEIPIEALIPYEEVQEIPKKINYETALKEMGYYKGEYRDEAINIRNSLLRFQSEHNLTVDGKIGPEVKGAFEKRMKDSNFQYSDIIMKQPTGREWIVINKTKRILTLYRGNQVVKKYPIAQGKLATYTPEGQFKIVTKAINPSWSDGKGKYVKGGSPQNPLGYRWLGIDYQGGWKYGIHGNSAPNSIGTDISLGCVRMINGDVEELYQIINVNTPVWIGTDNQLREWGVYQYNYLSWEK